MNHIDSLTTGQLKNTISSLGAAINSFGLYSDGYEADSKGNIIISCETAKTIRECGLNLQALMDGYSLAGQPQTLNDTIMVLFQVCRKGNRVNMCSANFEEAVLAKARGLGVPIAFETCAKELKSTKNHSPNNQSKFTQILKAFIQKLLKKEFYSVKKSVS